MINEMRDDKRNEGGFSDDLQPNVVEAADSRAFWPSI